MIKLTKIYFVRHCEATGNLNRTFQGSTNTDITELGAKQLRDYMVIIEYIRKALEVGCGTPSEMAYQDAIGVVCALGEYSRSKIAEYAEATAEIQLLKKPEA